MLLKLRKTKELLQSPLKLPVQPVDVIPEIIQGCKTTVGLEQQSSQSQNSDSKCNISLSQYSKTEDEQVTKLWLCVDPANLPQMSMDLTSDEGCSPPKKKQKRFDIEHLLLGCDMKLTMHST